MMPLKITLSACLVLVPAWSGELKKAQREGIPAVQLRIVHRNSCAKEIPSGFVAAVFPNGISYKEDTNQIWIHPRPEGIRIGDANALRVWFSYTKPIPKGWVGIEADGPEFGALLHKKYLYVCSYNSPELSAAALNHFLTVATGTMTEVDAKSAALLLAQCSEELKILADTDEDSFLRGIRSKLGDAIQSPTVHESGGAYIVTFFSWTALPQGEVSKWSVSIKGAKITEVKREHIANI